MSLSIHNRNSRRKSKKPSEQKELVGQASFIGCDFVTRISDIVDSVESFSVNPNILFKGDSVLVDYGDALKGRKRIKDEITTFFEATAVKGDTLTLTDGEFIHEGLGDAEIKNLSGTYTKESFNPNTGIALLTKVSVKNESSTYSRYDKNFFINGSLKWTTSSSTQENKTEQINELVNRIGKHSANSFSSVFKTVKPNDTLDIKVGSSISSYTVSSYYVDAEGMEHIELIEDVPTDTTLFGSEVFIMLRRRKEETEEKSRRPSLPIAIGGAGGGGAGGGFNPSTPLMSPKKDTGTAQPKEISDLVKSAKDTLASIKNRKTTQTSTVKTSPVNSSISSSLQGATEKWQQSGKKTFHVSIENDSKGSWSYVIDGKTKPTLELDAGKTYKFNISHISNGIKGFTNMYHEFIIMGEQGVSLKPGSHVRSSAKIGTRGAYVYITIPTNKNILKYLCKERTVLGGGIEVANTRKQPRQSTQKQPCREGYHLMPADGDHDAPWCMKGKTHSDSETLPIRTSTTSQRSCREGYHLMPADGDHDAPWCMKGKTHSDSETLPIRTSTPRTSTPSNGGMSSGGY